VRTTPKVTVAIPMFNHEAFIGRTIQSVLSQSFADFELLVFDDGSTDRSVEIVRAFDDPRIRLTLNEKNLGPEANWNLAISQVRGAYGKLLCGDDVLMPDCLAKQVAILDDPANADVGFVTCSKLVLDPKDRVVTKRRFARRGTKLSGQEGIRRLIFFGSNPFGEPGAGLFRASLIPQVAGYRARIPYLIDLDFWCQLLQLGSIYILPDFLFGFRISSTSWSSRIGLRQYRQWVDFLNQLRRENNFPMSAIDVLIGATTGAAQFAARIAFFKIFARA